jgi:hypothetical protein
MGGNVDTLVLREAAVAAPRQRSLACRFCNSLIEVKDEPEGTLLECDCCGSVGALA